MLLIKTINGHECWIEDEDLVHYKNAEVLGRARDEGEEEPDEE